VLIDPKRVELVHYSEFPHLIGGRVLEDLDDTLETLTELIGEMDRRTSKLQQAKW